MGVTFTGLSSGLDTAALVNSLVAAERAPAEAIASKQSDLNTQKSIVGSLSSALSALGTAVLAMNQASELQPRSVTSSDGRITVAASAGAAATVHDVRVSQLARGQITSSREFGSAAAGAAGTGTLSITTAGSTKAISYTASDSLSAIASRINDAGAGVSASVLFDGTSHRLMVASTATGTAAAPTFVETGDGLGLSDPANIKIEAKDAIAVIDGVEITRGSNVIGDAVAGLTFSLVSQHAVGEQSSQVKVALDGTGLTDKLTKMVSAYNAVNAALHVQLDYTGTRKGTSTLFGDSTLRQLQGALGSVMSGDYGDTALGDIGITRAKDGSLTLDAAKLTAALAKDPEAVNQVFVTGGFAEAMTKLTTAYTRAGDGILASKSKALSARFTVLQTQADQINRRADTLKATLEKQFNALETAMSALRSQASFITSTFG